MVYPEILSTRLGAIRRPIDAIVLGQLEAPIAMLDPAHVLGSPAKILMSLSDRDYLALFAREVDRSCLVLGWQ